MASKILIKGKAMGVMWKFLQLPIRGYSLEPLSVGAIYD